MACWSRLIYKLRQKSSPFRAFDHFSTFKFNSSPHIYRNLRKDQIRIWENCKVLEYCVQNCCLKCLVSRIFESTALWNVAQSLDTISGFESIPLWTITSAPFYTHIFFSSISVLKIDTEQQQKMSTRVFSVGFSFLYRFGEMFQTKSKIERERILQIWRSNV